MVDFLDINRMHRCTRFVERALGNPLIFRRHALDEAQAHPGI